MLEISGKYNTAKVFTDLLDDFFKEQIVNLCNQSFVEGCKLRLMPVFMQAPAVQSHFAKKVEIF